MWEKPEYGRTTGDGRPPRPARHPMRGIRQWLSSAALVALPTTVLAQEPDGFAGGTVVGGTSVQRAAGGTPASSFRPAATLPERPVFTATALVPPEAAPPTPAPALAQ